MSVSEYCIVRGFRPDRMAEKVKKMLDEGWQPQGSLQLSTFWDHGNNCAVEVYAQAMVKP